MNPNPLSLTSRLMLPLGIRVSLGPPGCPKTIEYQVPFHRVINKLHGFWPGEAADPTRYCGNEYASVQMLGPGIRLRRVAESAACHGSRVRSWLKAGTCCPSLERFGSVSGYFTVTV